MTKQEVIDYITTKLAAPITLAQNVIDSFLKVLDFSSQSAVDDVIPDWTNAITFQTDGSDGGKYCLHPDDNGKKRIFETKIDDNLNNEPPTDPDVTENASWEEISQSAGSGISEWAAGVYGSGLVIVYHNHSVNGRGLYQLLEASRPYSSTDIETEITAGDWVQIGVGQEYVDSQILSNINGIAWKASVKVRTTMALPSYSPTATTLTATANGVFPNIDGVTLAVNDDILVMDEVDQPRNGIYTLTQLGDVGTPWILTRRGDADSTAELQNAVVSVDEGTVHADTSWRQETDTVVLGTSNVIWAAFNPSTPDATETVKGIVELATTAEATTGTDTDRAVTPAGLKAAIDENVESGTYTPTLTASSNVTSSTAYVCQFMRVGNVVTVSGRVDITETGAGVTALRIELPIASNFAAGEQCAGTGFTVASQIGAQVIADTVNNEAFLKYSSAGATSREFWFSFTYLIV